MKRQLTTSLILSAFVGCASCSQQQPVAQSFASPAASTGQSSALDAIPAFSMGWKTVSFSIPKPKLIAVPRPQRGPQMVGIPIMPSTAPMVAAQPMAVQRPMVVQQQVAQVPVAPQNTDPSPQGQPTPQGAPAPQSTPAPQNCSPPCQQPCGECCTTSEVKDDFAEIMQQVAKMQQSLDALPK